ncbi:MAG: ribonuclease HII [Rhodospirillaceae bacterium]|nr:ribonuclease HII [Rhodospirillaceae bacterium]
MQKTLVLSNHDLIFAGVDEAGRGPLAGPVVAAAVVLSDQFPIKGLRDSKLLSETQRFDLSKVIRRRAMSFALAFADPAEIDNINILQASLLAMERAVKKLKVTPDMVKVDGPHKPLFRGEDNYFEVEAVVRGDQLVPAISAASVLAKICRDRVMRRFHRHYPYYGFDSNKGYGTKDHLDALMEFGPCPIHRKTFSPVKRALLNG